ncbi:DUF2790 domain-containing protein [Pseudomonas sp. NPDC090208]|uniref:DUF2790 domain-containing protein n=1 Tax=Pseudomonas sp. NPDC090208 TaxID=3364478 RepID=UPI00380BBD0C
MYIPSSWLASPTSARSLDIVQVISQTTDDASCTLVPMHLVYKDFRDLVHTLDYTIIGSGRSNGWLMPKGRLHGGGLLSPLSRRSFPCDSGGLIAAIQRTTAIESGR